MQQSCGAATMLMTPAEIQARFPFYKVDDIVMGSYNPVGEGWFDGATMMQWWRRKAREGRMACAGMVAPRTRVLDGLAGF